MSKGSNRRPAQVDRDTWSRNWERTFGNTPNTPTVWDVLKELTGVLDYPTNAVACSCGEPER